MRSAACADLVLEVARWCFGKSHAAMKVAREQPTPAAGRRWRQLSDRTNRFGELHEVALAKPVNLGFAVLPHVE